MARKACLSGDYAKGVDILSDLFLDTRDATYIFNQGRCYEQNNRYEDAVARFREYLRKATDLAPELRAETEKHIAECQTLIARGGADTVPKPDARAEGGTVAPPVASPSVPNPPPSGDTLVVDPVAKSAETETKGRGLRIAGLVCGGVGVAAVGTGIYFYTRARYYSDKVSSTINPSRSDQQAGKDAETFQWLFYGIGGAALATGITLSIVGWSQDTGTTVAPLAGPDLAGLTVQGVF